MSAAHHCKFGGDLLAFRCFLKKPFNKTCMFFLQKHLFNIKCIYQSLHWHCQCTTWMRHSRFASCWGGWSYFRSKYDWSPGPGLFWIPRRPATEVVECWKKFSAHRLDVCKQFLQVSRIQFFACILLWSSFCDATIDLCFKMILTRYLCWA